MRTWIDPAPRSATAIALENTVLELVDKDYPDGEFNQTSSDFREVLSSLVTKLRKTTQNVSYSHRSSEQRQTLGNHILKALVVTILLFFTTSGSPVCTAGAAGRKAEDFPKVTSRKWTTKYDRYFRKYTKRYFGAGFNWKWFKAQAIAESNLKHNARSWVNAKGIMQLMPKTFYEIKKKNPSFADINEPRWNIAAGIYYDRHLYQKWRAKRPFRDKISFTFASYNAGFRNIVKAQKVCNKNGLNENLWHNIKLVAPRVRGWRHRETLGYVDKIAGMME